MEDFFEELKSKVLGIFVEDLEHSGVEINWNDAEKEFNKINWDSKKFYVDLAMSSIYLSAIH